MLTVVILTAPLLAPIGSLAVALNTGVSAAIFNANGFLYQATAGGYFADAAELNPFLHTWSLSVEEQFYFLIPALLFIAWRIGNRRERPLATLRVLVAVVIIVSLSTSLYLGFDGGINSADSLRSSFFSPMTRTWEFAAGIALVLLPARWAVDARRRSTFVVGGIGLIAVSMLAFSDLTRIPGTAVMAPVIGTALVIYAMTSPGGEQSATPSSTLRPLIWLGNLSYGWNLWHWPLIVFAGAFWPTSGRVPLLAAAATSLLLAWLSYRCFEPRFRTTASTPLRRTFLLVGCCIVAPLASATLALPLTSRIAQNAEVVAFAEGRNLHVDVNAGCDQSNAPRDVDASACRWGNVTTASSVVLRDGGGQGRRRRTVGLRQRGVS